MTYSKTTSEQRIDHFFSMPSARADRWRDLVGVARAWSGGRADRNAVEAALAELGPIEDFHAFPGARLMAGLRERLQGGDAKGFAALVRRVSAAIVTRDFKHDAAEWETIEQVADSSADSQPSALGRGEAKRPYFEMLVVAPGAKTHAARRIAEMRKLLPTKYPNLTIVDIRPSDDDRRKAFDETQTLLRVHPKVKVVMAIASPAVPGAAEAVKQSGRKDVGVTGLGLPNASKPYLLDGVLDSAVLWNTKDLGYLTVHVATALAKGTPVVGTTPFSGGRLGQIEVRGDNVILGTPFTFTKANVGGFDF